MHRFRNFVGATLATAILLSATTTTYSSPYSDAVQAFNPDAYYRFDGSGLAGSDETGNHSFSSVESGINFNVAGPRPADGFQGMDATNNAWDFSSGLRAQVANYVPAVGQQPRTVIGWFNTDVTRTQHGGAIDLFGWAQDLKTPNTFKGWALKVDAGFDNSSVPYVGALGYDVVALNITGRQVDAKTTPIEPGDWHMVGAVYNGGVLGTTEIYVDGVLQELVNDTGVTPLEPSSEPSPYGFFIGRAAGGFAMDGQIDHVAVFVGEEGGNTPDYNNDGTVDAADYSVWRDTLGQNVDPGTGADGNGNGVIDVGDYDEWKANFGGTASGQRLVQGQDIIDLWNLAKNGVPGSTSTTTVPEPSAFLLTVLAFFPLFFQIGRKEPRYSTC